MADNEHMDDTTLTVPPEITSGEHALDVVQDVITKFLDAAQVDRVYGRPIRKGETVIIPAAEIVAGLGFGAGYGSGGSSGEQDEEDNYGEGGGGGGGGKIISRPAAVVIISPDSVRVEPVFDRTKVALAAITAAGFMLATLSGFLKPKDAIKQMRGD